MCRKQLENYFVYSVDNIEGCSYNLLGSRSCYKSQLNNRAGYLIFNGSHSRKMMQQQFFQSAHYRVYSSNSSAAGSSPMQIRAWNPNS
jgi:hypothetical protein